MHAAHGPSGGEVHDRCSPSGVWAGPPPAVDARPLGALPAEPHARGPPGHTCRNSSGCTGAPTGLCSNERPMMRPPPIYRTLWLGLLQLALLLPSPSASASSGASRGAPLLNGESVLLSRGATYRARLKLSFFQCFASRSKIVKKLEERGFSAVRLFMSKRELPDDWPSPFRRKAGSCERYAEATWTRGTRQQKRPSAIEKLWLSK